MAAASMHQVQRYWCACQDDHAVVCTQGVEEFGDLQQADPRNICA
jgi:hypothetical protein